jgi:hypothetical protein
MIGVFCMCGGMLHMRHVLLLLLLLMGVVVHARWYGACAACDDYGGGGMVHVRLCADDVVGGMLHVVVCCMWCMCRGMRHVRCYGARAAYVPRSHIVHVLHMYLALIPCFPHSTPSCLYDIFMYPTLRSTPSCLYPSCLHPACLVRDSLLPHLSLCYMM